MRRTDQHASLLEVCGYGYTHRHLVSASGAIQLPKAAGAKIHIVILCMKLMARVSSKYIGHWHHLAALRKHRSRET